MSFVAFVESLATLQVTGVKRRHAGPPSQINSADLPCTYPRLPTQTTNPISFGNTLTREGTCELALVVAPDTLDSKASNFALACALVDNLNTALATLQDSGGVVDTWSIRQTYEAYGGETVYIVLVATVEGSW